GVTARRPALRVAKTERRKFAEKTHDHVVGEWNPRMIAKLLLQNTIFIVAMGALLFASAGTLHWPAAWIFLVTSASIGPACGFWLAKNDSCLLRARMPAALHARPSASG